MTEPDNYEAFVRRALILGCSGEEASLWAEIALKRRWQPTAQAAAFDQAVLDYLVDLGSGETWANDLRRAARDEPADP